MAYTEYNFIISPLEPIRDVLIAELCEIGFESFVETESGVLAYISSEEVVASFSDLMAYNIPETIIKFTKKEIEDQNWNAKWESNFEPIFIDNRCVIRAPFHQKQPSFPLEVIIQPQMSFGTGHHETTYLICSILLESDLEGLRVLDMGCGTGVLAILAEKLGGILIDAIDIDEWSYRNTYENIELNNSKNITVFLGGKEQLQGKDPYQLILANINRNILLADMDTYIEVLELGGVIIFSGFYQQDLPLIREKAESLGLIFLEYQEKNDWVAVKLKKES